MIPERSIIINRTVKKYSKLTLFLISKPQNCGRYEPKILNLCFGLRPNKLIASCSHHSEKKLAKHNCIISLDKCYGMDICAQESGQQSEYYIINRGK